MLDFATLKNMFSADQSANEPSIQEYKEAKSYYHAKQLPAQVLSVLNERGQIPIVENIYKMIVNKILGYKMQSMQELKVSGRQEEDKPLATLLNDILKVFSQQAHFDKEIIKRDKDLMFGMAVIELWVRKRENDYLIDIKSLPTDSFLIDKYSTDKNASDARRFHKSTNIDESQALALFGENITLRASTHNAERRAEIIESWILESSQDQSGEIIESWNRYIWNSENGILSYEQAPFKNHTHPFIIAKYQIDDLNQWYGLFRDIKPLQDYINFAENKIANMMGSFKAFVEEGAFSDVNNFIKQASTDNAIVFLSQGALKEKKIEIIQHHANIAELSQKTTEKRNLAKLLSGLNDEALGMAVNRQSGTAISQRREAGLMGLQDFIKSGDDMDRLIFEKALSFITYYFDKEQVFRIVDKKTGERFFSINDPQNADSQIRVGNFDLIFKTTLKTEGREERFAHWAEMMKTIGQVRPDLLAHLLPLMLKDVDSPIIEDIEEVIAQAEQQQAEQAQAQQQAQAQAQELELAQIQSKIAESQGKANKYQAQAEATQQILVNASQETANPPSFAEGDRGRVNPNRADSQNSPSLSTGERIGERIGTGGLQKKGLDLR